MFSTLLALSFSQISREPYRILGLDIFDTHQQVQQRCSQIPKQDRTKTDACALLTNPSKRKNHDRKFSPPKKQKNPYINERDPDPVRIRLPLPVKAAMNGINISFTVLGDHSCPVCNGTGNQNSREKCGRCGGQGQINKVNGERVQKVQCPACKGQKVKMGTKCAACKGSKMRRGQVKKSVWIEPGFNDNQQITIPNLVDERTAEDAILVLQTVASEGWTRKGADVYYDLQVPLKDSLLGFTREVRLIDGSTLNLRKDKVQNNEKQSFSQKGLKLKGKASRGNLHLTMKVRLQQNMSEDVRDRWEAFFRKYPLS